MGVRADASAAIELRFGIVKAAAPHHRHWHDDSSPQLENQRAVHHITKQENAHVLCWHKPTDILTTGIISADKYSRAFEKSRHPEENYRDEAERQRLEASSRKSAFEKLKDWGKENRYPIVGGSWVASMIIALAIVGRSPHLSTQQKIVQARVYAQGLTLAVLVATAAFEIGDKGKGEGRWETVKIIDPDDPTHKHLIDKRIHHERYAGEDQWRGELVFFFSFTWAHVRMAGWIGFGPG